VNDLRSSVVKEACNLLSFLSVRLKDGFATDADFFVPVLFRLTQVPAAAAAVLGALSRGFLHHSFFCYEHHSTRVNPLSV
jgi:hypothetical protein